MTDQWPDSEVPEMPEEGAPIRLQIANIGGDLRLRGWDEDRVAADGVAAAFEPDEEGVIAIQVPGDLSLRVPPGVEIVCHNVGGDARLSGLSGPARIDNVGGDLVARGIGSLQARHIGGDLRAKAVFGDIAIGQIGGDATLREIEGEVKIEAIGADLYVRELKGVCAVGRVGSDLVLSTEFMAGGVYRFTVGSDIVCRVPPQASVRFRIADCGDLVIDAPDAELSEGREYDEVVFGDGAALVELSAGSDIRLVEKDEDYMMAINFQLEGELASRLDGIEEKLAEQLSGLDELLSEKAAHLRMKADRAAERAMQEAERAMRKAEKKVSGKHKRGFSFSFGGDWPPPRGPHGPGKPHVPRPPEPHSGVTDEERLMILRMVEARQISVEEAEKLLAALEGR